MDDNSTEISMNGNSTEFSMYNNSTEINNYTSTSTSGIKNITTPTDDVTFLLAHQSTQKYILWNFSIFLVLLALHKIFKKNTWICKGNISNIFSSFFEYSRPCGYLIFQNYILKFMIIVFFMHIFEPSIDSLQVLNFNHVFWGFTGANIHGENSVFLWFQVTIVFLYLPLAIYFMRQFVIEQKIEANLSKPSKSVMITGQALTLNHFMKKEYQNIMVRKIVYAEALHDSSGSHADTPNWNVIRGTMKFCNSKSSQDEKSTFMQVDIKPNFYARGGFGPDHVSPDRQLNSDWYSQFEMEDDLQKMSLTLPSGTTIISLADDNETKLMYENIVKGLKELSADENYTNKWSVQYVPYIDDLLWKNLLYPQNENLYKKEIFIQSGLFIMSALHSLITIYFLIPDSVDITENTDWGSEEFLLHFMSWFAFMLFVKLLISLERQAHDWSKSIVRYKTLMLGYISIILMLVVYPSMVYESVDSWTRWYIDHHEYENHLYVPYPGLCTINFIITSTFIGTAIELFRMKDFDFIFVWLYARCKKRYLVKKEDNGYFPLDFSLLQLLGITVTILGMGPLNFWAIAFGTWCIALKHLVDNNKMAQMTETEMSTQQYAIAIKYFIIAAVIPQFRFLLFLWLHYGATNITLYSAVGIVLTMLFLLAHKHVEWCENIIPFPYQRCLMSADHTEASDSLFTKDLIERDNKKLTSWETVTVLPL